MLGVVTTCPHSSCIVVKRKKKLLGVEFFFCQKLIMNHFVTLPISSSTKILSLRIIQNSDRQVERTSSKLGFCFLVFFALIYEEGECKNDVFLAGFHRKLAIRLIGWCREMKAGTSFFVCLIPNILLLPIHIIT